MLALLLLAGAAFAKGDKPDYIKVTSIPSKQRVDVTIGGELFTSLLYADSLKKPSLFPIYTAKQNMITRGWPLMPKPKDRTDYAHQFGLWFDYGNVNGADYWRNDLTADTSKLAYGSIKVQKIVNMTSGDGKGTLTVVSKWINPGNKAVLEETSTFVFKVDKGLRIIDRYITLKALTNVEFKDNKNGLYAIRVATELGQPVTSLESAMFGATTKSDSLTLTGHFASSEHVNGDAVFGKRAKWMKIIGSVNGEAVTLVMMDSPGNINYPAYWMTRAYGLMSANPLGAEVFTNGKEKVDFTMAKGKQTTFKYRFIQGGKKIDDDTLDRLFTDFSEDNL
jgi:hypothetical protein